MRSLQIALISLVFATATCFAQRGGGGHGGGGGHAMGGGGGLRGGRRWIPRGSAGGGGSAVVGRRWISRRRGRRLPWRLWRRISAVTAATDIAAVMAMAVVWGGSDSDLDSVIPTMAAITAIRTHMDIHTTAAVIIPTLLLLRSLLVCAGSVQRSRSTTAVWAAQQQQYGPQPYGNHRFATWLSASTTEGYPPQQNGYPPPPPPNGPQQNSAPNNAPPQPPPQANNYQPNSISPMPSGTALAILILSSTNTVFSNS